MAVGTKLQWKSKMDFFTVLEKAKTIRSKEGVNVAKYAVIS